MNKKLIRKMLTAAGGPLFPWLEQNTEWVNDWKFRTTPASRSRVLSGKGVETDKQYTERRKKEETKRTWRSDAADIAHGIGEGVLALHPYTAIPYFGAKVGQDVLNGNVSWLTALNASVPLFHLAPQAVGLREATNVALEDAANAGSKTARNLRVAREIKLATKNKPNIEVPKPIIRTKVGDVEIDNPGLYYHQSDAGKAKNFVSTGRMRTPIEEYWLAKEEAGEKIPLVLRSGIKPGYPQDPGSAMFAQGNLWYGLTPNKPDLLVTAREMPIANKNASIMSNKASLRQLEAQGTRRVTNDNIYTQGPHNRQNTTAYTWVPGYGYRLVVKEPSTSLKFFERKPARISEAEKAGIPKGERNVKQGYLLKDAIEEANKFAEKWGYDKLSQNATLLDIENLYNQHNTFFRGVTTEQLENTRDRVAKELGINPEQLTNDLYLLYVSTHPWPGNDRIWVTPFSHYGKIYGNADMIGGKGLLSAVMRPWKTTKDIKQWPKLSLWTLGFKENTSNPVITPWVSNAPDAIRSLGALSEFLVKPPLIYRGLGKDFKGTLLLYLKYKDNQGKLGWIESLVGELPLEIIIEKQGGKMNILEFLKNGSGIHIKEKNKGSFTRWCGGNVTEECIRKGKASSNPKIRKKATFADNARHFKHRLGGSIVETLGGGNIITAKLKAKSNLTKRKAPDWDNLDRGYRYLTLDMKLPHDLAIAIMGNVVEESQGDYKAALKNGRGRGLIQWDGRPAPKGRYGQWGSIWASVAKKANVYDPDTDTVKNYWAPWNGLKGDLVRLKFISAPLKLKARIYAESYLRPGKPRIADRQLSAMQLDSIYNPKIKNIVVQLKVGGKIDFLSLGGIASGIKNIVNNVGNFMKSDTGKSILSAGSSLLGLGLSISNSGKIVDLANAAKEAVNERREIDKRTKLNQHFLNILNEELLNPIIEVNGSPIHTNGVDVSNRAYNKAINTFSFDDSKYNQEIQLIDLLALQALGENSSSMMGSVGNLINSIGGIAGSFWNKSTTPKTSLVITGNPDSSKQVITTNSGMSGTVDDWRKAILG